MESIETSARRLRARATTARELTEACLARITEREPSLNAFRLVTAESARAEAGARDRELSTGSDRGPLHGIPFSLKDLFDVRGLPTTAGSPFFSDNIAAADAYVVERLRDAGAVLVGKTNLHEWAFGVTNDNPHFGPTRNPHDERRIPGGSSGGSGAAIAAGECVASLGTDTGGSIRIPAALCGIVGLKPTRGRVSTRGVVPLSWTLDHVGPMTSSVRDAAIVLRAIAGYDPDDPGSVDTPVDDYLAHIEKGVDGMTIGIPETPFFTSAAPDVAALVRGAADRLARDGARLVPVTLPPADEVLSTQRVIIGSDAATYHRERLAQPESFGSDVLERLKLGMTWSGTDVAAARRARARLRRAIVTTLRSVDALLTPTTPIAAPLREGLRPADAAAQLTSFVSPFNLTGLPAISLPCGTNADRLPVGMQLVAGPWREAHLLRIARAYERGA